MTVFVLDSSALIRYIDSEPGADRVNALLKACVAGRAEVCISAVQWGEIAGNLRKRLGATEEVRVLSSLLPSEVQIVPVSGEPAAPGDSGVTGLRRDPSTVANPQTPDSAPALGRVPASAG